MAPRGRDRPVSPRPRNPKLDEWRTCRYCGTNDAYQNNGVSWDAHKATCEGWKKEMETMTTQTTTPKAASKKSSTHVLTAEQVEQAVEMTKDGKGFVEIVQTLGKAPKPWPYEGESKKDANAWYHATKHAVAVAMGSADAVTAARKSASTAKKETAALAQVKKDAKIVAKVEALKAEVKPDPKPVAKKRERKQPVAA